jgi:serine/threonine protein kinase
VSRKRSGKRQKTAARRATPGATPDVAETQLRGAATVERGPADQVSSGSAQQPLDRGALLAGDYRIMEVMESDEIAISYKAEDVNLGVAVLLKEFAPAEYIARKTDGTLAPRAAKPGEAYDVARARFLREAQTLVHFRHPNIVRAHRMFEANQTAYIVLDYEQAETFDAWLSGLRRRPTQAELDRLVVPLLGALDHVHASGYVHGDIRTGTLLIRSNGTPVLVHFANAAPVDQVKAVADLGAVAALLCLAVTGKAPRQGREHLAAIKASDGYRAEFLEAIARVLAAPTQDRPQSVSDWGGLRPPDDHDLPASGGGGSVTTIVHERSEDASGKTAAATAPAKTGLSQFATRVISALPEIKEETDIPKQDFERWLLPTAMVVSLLGAVLFTTGLNFALAAVCQVAASALFFVRGYMPLSRFLSHTTRQAAAIVRRVEQATRTATWMIAAILALLTVNPLFVNRFIPATGEVPVAMLSVIIGVPALIMALCGYWGTPVRRGIAGLAVGTANLVVLAFSTLLFFGFAYTTLSTPESAVIHPAVQVNRYLYIIATIATGTLGVLIFLSRVSAKQRLKQAAMGP